MKARASALSLCTISSTLPSMASLPSSRMPMRSPHCVAQALEWVTIKPVTDNQAKQRITLLTQENAELRAELGAMKDRLANVERIVTDEGYGLSSEIEKLRGSVSERALAQRPDEGTA